MNAIQKHVLKRKEVNELTDRELLMELVEEKRFNETLRVLHQIWVALLWIAIIIVCCIYGPKVIQFFRDLYDLVRSINAQFQSVKESLQSLSDTFEPLFGKFLH